MVALPGRGGAVVGGLAVVVQAVCGLVCGGGLVVYAVGLALEADLPDVSGGAVPVVGGFALVVGSAVPVVVGAAGVVVGQGGVIGGHLVVIWPRWRAPDVLSEGRRVGRSGWRWRVGERMWAFVRPRGARWAVWVLRGGRRRCRDRDGAVEVLVLFGVVLRGVAGIDYLVRRGVGGCVGGRVGTGAAGYV